MRKARARIKSLALLMAAHPCLVHQVSAATFLHVCFASQDEAKRKEEELRQQAEEFQRIKDEHERKITALYRQLQSAHTVRRAGGAAWSTCRGHVEGGP